MLPQIFEHLGVEREIDLSEFPTGNHIFPGIKSEIPARLRPYLQALYGDKTRELVAFLKEQFQLTPPPEWTTLGDANEPGPFVLEENYNGYGLFLYRSKFHALTAGMDCRTVRLPEEAVRACKLRGEHFVGDSLDEVKHYVDHGATGMDREAYLAQRFFQDGAARFSQAVIEVERSADFRIVLCQDKFFVLSRAGDGAEPTGWDDLARRARQGDGRCFVGDSLSEVYQFLAPPQLVLEDYRQFNVVAYRGKFYGCDCALGPMDVRVWTNAGWTNYARGSPW